MNSSQAIYAFYWLARDTFRQAQASRIFWIMLAVTGLCVLFCLSVSIEGGDNLRPDKDFLYHNDKLMTGPSFEAGRFGFFFGAFKVTLARDREAGVHFLQIILGNWGGGALGLLLTLVWTAGFVPEFLQPRQSAVLLAKPAPRWLFVVGKFVGVVVFVAFQATVFFLSTWLALGIKTGVWSDAYLLGIPILVLHFAAIFSFSVLLAVLTHSTVACVLGSVVFWVICLAMNYARYAVLSLPELAPDLPSPSPFLLFLTNASYWILPKPADFLMLLEQALDVGAHLTTLSSLPVFRSAQAAGVIHFAGSLASSFLFAVVMLFAAGRQLAQTDY